MKIMFLERSMGMGGAQRQMVALATELKRRGHDVIVALFYSEGAFIGELETAGVKVEILKKSSRWDVAGFTYRLRKYIRSQSPDVLCTFLEVPNFFSALVKLTMPGLPVVWGVRASNMDLSLYDSLSRFSHAATAKLSRLADCIVANSEAGKAAAIARGVRAGKMIVVPNGIDTARFAFDADGRLRVRRELGVADDEVLVGLVARLDPMKGHGDFIQAATRLPNLKFVCVGEPGPFSVADIQAKAAKCNLSPDRFIVAGKRTDITAVLSAIDIACSTSIYGEGFSNSIAEAMVCGRPCVVTDVGDSKLIVGDAGTVIRAGDIDALTSAIASLASDKEARERISQAATARIQSFSVAKMVDRFEAVFRQVAAS